MKKYKQWLQAVWQAPRRGVAWMIGVYQRTLSPDTGWFKVMFPYGYCPYHPTCSEYGRQAVLRCGLVRGSVLTLWRILRCNPWSKGGDDPVPCAKK